MKFDTYYRKLDRADRIAFAERSGTSAEYIEIHLLPRRKKPREKLMRNMSAASNGKVSYKDVVGFFYMEA